MRTKPWFILGMICVLLIMTASMASAGYNDQTWFIGVQGGYFFVPINMYYEEYEKISGSPYGIQAGYSWDFIEIVGMMENWTINIADGDWLMMGADEEDMSYLEYDMGMFSLECMARFKIKAHEIVQPIFGIGLGMGFTYGEVKGHDYYIDGQGNLYPDWPDGEVGKLEDKEKPAILPVIDLMAGVRFVIPENVSIDVNLGIKNGWYAGLGVIFFY